MMRVEMNSTGGGDKSHVLIDIECVAGTADVLEDVETVSLSWAISLTKFTSGYYVKSRVDYTNGCPMAIFVILWLYSLHKGPI